MTNKNNNVGQEALYSISVFTDGASRGNPGQAAIGIVAFQNEAPLFEHEQTIGIATNNEAEWHALLKALQICQEKNIQTPKFFLDSELVVKQLNGQYKVKKEELKTFYSQAQELNRKVQAEFFHVRREKNKKADALANKALDAIKNKNK